MKTFLLSFLLIFSLSSAIAQQRTVEVYGFAGYTGVDPEEWAGTRLNDWDQFASGWYIQVFPYSNEIVSLGLEYGYSYLLFYTFPFTTTLSERNIDANRLLAMARLFPERNLIIEGGLGMYFFEDFTNLGLALAGGYRIPLAQSWSLPIKFRTNFIFDSDASIIQPGLDIGVSYGF